METIINFIRENWLADLGIGLFLFELAVRLWPTEKNYSIIDLIFKILAVVIPNNRTK